MVCWYAHVYIQKHYIECYEYYTSFRLAIKFEKKNRTEYKFELKLSLTSNAINII